jgi:1-phosphofructokinase
MNIRRESMIYTVTLNPSLDYIVSVDNFMTGRVNRTSKELMFPGGKGINVSIVLHNLGMTSTALGFIAGFTGEEIKRQVREFGIDEQFIAIPEGLSRINVKLRSNEESEINGMGPNIGEKALSEFMSQLDELQKGDVLVLAGSIPDKMPSTMYRDIMERLQDRGIMIVVDATKDLLVNVLELHPFLIKPNNFELGEIFGVELESREQIITYAKKMQDMGARNVLVSMAGDGAIMVAEDGSVYETPAPKGKVVNSVGAGDSMVAGFVYGYLSEQSYEKAFYMGVSTGSASAFSENLATKEEVEKLYQSLRD